MTRIILVEDNPDEEQLALRALRAAREELDVLVLRDGSEAIEHVRSAEESSDFEPPHLVLLDLKLPKVGGLEVLRHLKQSVKFKSVPIVVCSSSDEESDVAASRALGADQYLRKSVDYNEFSDSIKQVADVWLPP